MASSYAHDIVFDKENNKNSYFGCDNTSHVPNFLKPVTVE